MFIGCQIFLRDFSRVSVFLVINSRCLRKNTTNETNVKWCQNCKKNDNNTNHIFFFCLKNFCDFLIFKRQLLMKFIFLKKFIKAPVRILCFNKAYNDIFYNHLQMNLYSKRDLTRIYFIIVLDPTYNGCVQKVMIHINLK